MIEIVARQMLVMGIFMAIGAVLYKTKQISQEGSKTLTSILIYLITPVAVFKSLCVERTQESMKSFLISFLLCCLAQGLGLVCAHIIYKKRPMEEYAITYPNAGFFGIPVIQAVLGYEAVFYIAPLVVLVGTLQHSYGVRVLLGSKTKFQWKRVLLAPNFVGLIAGMLVFFSGVGPKMPKLVTQCVDLIANMNTFFAMSILGIFLAQADLKRLYKNIDMYAVSGLRLLVLPVICAIIFRFLPAPDIMKMAILLSFAGPVGSNIANYSLLYNKDYGTASLYVAISTVLCLISLPLFSAIAEIII